MKIMEYDFREKLFILLLNILNVNKIRVDVIFI